MNNSSIHEILSRYETMNRPFQDIVIEKFSIASFLAQRECVLFGAAELANRFLAFAPKIGVSVKAIADNDPGKWGSYLQGIPVINPAKLNGLNCRTVITSKYVKPITKQLFGMGIEEPIPHYVFSVIYPNLFSNPFHSDISDLIRNEKEQIIEAFSLLADGISRELFGQLLSFRFSLSPCDLPNPIGTEYFPDTDWWHLSAQETFVDVGAHNGDTLHEFIRQTQGNFKQHIAFEPDEINFAELEKSVPDQYSQSTILHKIGVGADSAIVAFASTGGLDSCISADGDRTIEIVSLDTALQGKVPTFVKADVEGYELDVIKGMKNIIKEHNPKIAICAYHRPDHLWKILLAINALNSKYNFFLRHYEHEIYGTVLYCSPK